MDKGVYAQWEKKGRRSMEDLAAEKIDGILETHTVIEPLSEGVQAEIKGIVEREQAWSDGKEQ
jgi:trimethylamine:corrinoid methyltransferase-like protein